jgi:FixJ family two-component response regulator
MSETEIKMMEKVNSDRPLDLLTHLVDDEQYIINLVKQFLESIGLKKVREWRDSDAYNEMLLANPDIKPNICIFDFRFHGTLLTGLELTDTAIKRNEDAIIFMITDYEFVPDILRFQELGGFLWIRKSRPDFQSHFTFHLQRAVKKLEALYKSRNSLNQVEIPKIPDRVPFSTDEKTD